MNALIKITVLNTALILASCGGGGNSSTDSSGASSGDTSASATASANTGASGSASSTSTSTTPGTPTTATTPSPSGLFVGYYQEDPLNNPEDPTAGAFSMTLPSQDAAFSGSMYFTYVGCQNNNVGAVEGTKAGASLSGTWAGTVDGSPQRGSYTGTYEPDLQSYSGTYSNAGGKQYRDLLPRIAYTIAANGTWEMFPVDSHTPADFQVAVSGRTISWPAETGVAYSLVYVLDPVIAQGTGNPVVWQSFQISSSMTVIPGAVTLQTGKEYIAVVGLSNSQFVRKAFGSRRFTAQ